MGTCQPCPALELLSSKIRSMLSCCGSPNKYDRLDSKLEKKILEVKRKSSGRNSFKSINSIIMRFPQFKEGLKKIRGVFDEYDEDSNGCIDRKELEKCLEMLQLHLTDSEVDDLFYSCDIDGSKGIQFNEFIVLLCLIYLLMESCIPHNRSKMDSPQVEATFDTIVEAFLFLDKNGKGKLNKKDMIKAMNDDASPWEKSPAHVTKTRIREMDWDRNGKISFREFLFAFIDWVGIETEDDDHVPEI